MPPRCSVCGERAELLGPALDPRYSLGVCSRQPKSCGRVPVILDRETWANVARQRQAESRRRAHARHLRTRLSVRCPDCGAILDYRKAQHAIPSL